MIEVTKKIHDDYSVEFKIGYNVTDTVQVNDFFVKMWFFTPSSLSINRQKYNADMFYRDLKENIRLITPSFNLRDIASEYSVPFLDLQRAFEELSNNPSPNVAANYEYSLKMFLAIFRSSIRDMLLFIEKNKKSDIVELLIDDYLNNVEEISARYRDMKRIINVPTVAEEQFNYFRFGDEYISNAIDYHSFKVMRKIMLFGNNRFDKDVKRIMSLIEKEKEYRISNGYLVVQKDSQNNNRDYVFRMGMLKRFVDSDLFLNVKKKRDAVITEQFYYSLAAGISMIFATAVAFSFQQKYGSFTMPLFVALVVSYMLKDRIKELMRYYFAHRRSTKYFDNKTTVSIGNKELGWSREAFDFIAESNVPREVISVRGRSPLLEADNKYNQENIMLYRKQVRVNREVLTNSSNYKMKGINEILRFSLRHFMNKMDDPQEFYNEIYEDGNIGVVTADKVYYVNVVLNLQTVNQNEYRRYRIVCSRNGILDIEDFI